MRVRAFAVMLLVSCGSGAGTLEGAGFQPEDAIYNLPVSTAEETRVFVSDAPGLCERLREGRPLAGFRLLAVRGFEEGATLIDLRHFDSECAVIEAVRSHQGWVEMKREGFGPLDMEIVFRAGDRSVSGRVFADHCDLPSPTVRGCP